jgi:hypothetical protein
MCGAIDYMHETTDKWFDTLLCLGRGVSRFNGVASYSGMMNEG